MSVIQIITATTTGNMRFICIKFVSEKAWSYFQVVISGNKDNMWLGKLCLVLPMFFSLFVRCFSLSPSHFIPHPLFPLTESNLSECSLTRWSVHVINPACIHVLSSDVFVFVALRLV